MTDEKIEHGAAEDGYGVPVTPTDVDASRKPPSEPSDPETKAAKESAGSDANES